MHQVGINLQLLWLGNYVNDNAGLWALVALPLLIVATVTGVLQLATGLRSASRRDEKNFELLRKRLRTRRIAGELSQRLILKDLLQARLKPPRGGNSVDVDHLYGRIVEGDQVLVAGEAGSGKTVLALLLVERGVDATAGHPDCPLVEVIPLKDWKPRALESKDWKGFLRWLSKRMHDRYPAFGRPFFRRLIESQRLVFCLDGLDELPSAVRPNLLRALRSYLDAGFPIVVLSRDPEMLASAPDESSPGSAPHLARYELLPLSDEALRQLPDWSSWESLVSNARQPNRVLSMLRNPLRLSVAAQTWGEQERPNALRDSEDPERRLWQLFLDRRLGSVGKAEPSLRRTSGLIALLSKQRDASAFKPSDLYLSAQAIPITVLLCAIPALLVTYRAGLMPFGTATVVLIALGLSDELVWLERVVLGFGARLSENWQVAVVLVAPAPAIFVASLGGVLMEMALAGDGGGWADLQSALLLTAFVTATFGLLGAFLAISDLKSRDMAEELTPSWMPGILVPILAVLVSAISQEQGFVTPICLSLIFATPWIYLCVSRSAMTIVRLVPGRGLAPYCKELARAGLLYSAGGEYRFRHDEITRQLGQEAADALAKQGKLSRLPIARRAEDFLHTGIDPAALTGADRLTAEMERLDGWQSGVVSIRTIFLCWGALQPKQALPLIESYAAKRPHSSTSVHLGEVLDALGDHEAADRLWKENLDLYRRSLWFVQKWVRREILQGNTEAVFDVLDSEQPAKEDEAEFRLTLAEVQTRFGCEDELSLASEGLSELLTAEEQSALVGAHLELARVKAELFGDRSGAEELLAPLLTGGPSLTSLVCARYAQLRLAAGAVDEAQQLSREALGLVEWDYDPLIQLEVLVTAAAAGSETGLEARIEPLLRFGWKLPGRGPALPEAGRLPAAVMERVFPEPHPALAPEGERVS